MIGIYKIQSKIKPERIYIGSSIDIKKRWREHIRTLRKNNHRSFKLQRHYSKYGEFDLEFSVIVECSAETLIAYEQFYIDSLNPYFNNRKIADSNLGLKRSVEAIEKMRMAKKGKPTWNKGLKNCYSEETLKKMRQVTRSEENKKNVSLFFKGRKQSKETIHKKQIYFKSNFGKPVNQYDLNGNFIKRWESINDAEKELNLNHSGITKICKGRGKTYHKFIWEYA